MNTYQQAAIKAGEWFLNTQIENEFDANRGRYLYCRHLKSDELQRSSGWQTGFALMAVLSLHRLTGEQKYLDSAALAVDWIKSLQMMDARNPALYGVFREEIPQTNWLHPRDALSAAWGLLCYSLYINDSDCLDRAKIFADWMIEYGFNGDWPLCTVNIGPGGLPTDKLKGSFQSGGILFFLDIYEATGEKRYQEAARRMSNYYVKHFFNDQGELAVLIDTTPEIEAKWPEDWRNMHRVNDDFGGIALVKDYELFGQREHSDCLHVFVENLLAMENPDGGFLDPEMEVGCASIPILLHRYLSVAPDAKKPVIKAATMRCLDRLLTFQQTSEDKQIDGAFLGMDKECRAGNGDWVNIRCTAYAIIALLLQSNHSVFPFKQDTLS
jgi:hypothetical protein